MINLIKNEITKIFKKKGIYITLIITLLFILLANLLCKYGENIANNMYSDSYKIYVETQIRKLDPNKTSDNAEYISLKTDLDIIKLEEKYGKDSWQYYVINEKIYPIIRTYNEYKYALEKNEESLKLAEQDYNKYISLLDSGNWQYFAKEDLKNIENEIKEIEEQKANTVSTVQISELESNLYDLNLQKQILEWRIQKDISYNSDRSRILGRYYNKQLNVYRYENNKGEKTYNDKLEYQESLKIANTYKYAIENDIKISQGNDLKGILEDFFSNYELFIVVIIVMIAGSIVSEEFNKGTIKLLLVKPYSRAKILLAKFITTLIIIVFAFVSIALLQIIVGGILFGFSDLGIPTIAYNFNTNSVMEMNIFKYLGIAFLHKIPLYILIATIAFAFSTAFTNTPIAIVISLLGYMSTSIINALVSNFKIVFMKFFITPNWDFTQYLFGSLPQFEHISFNFSVIICIIYFLLMIVPTFIIFKKKNIKNV